MITSRKELKEFIIRDSKASNRKSTRCRLVGDEVWSFQLSMRKLEYYHYKKNNSSKWLYMLPFVYYRLKYHYKSLRLGFTIPYNVFDKGLSIAHYGTIVVSVFCKVGENCRIHSCVNIGVDGQVPKAAQIGNNVYIGPGAKIVGDISIADGVLIGAGAVVVKSIDEPNTTWAGVPARKISDNSAISHLSPLLYE